MDGDRLIRMNAVLDLIDRSSADLDYNSDTEELMNQVQGLDYFDIKDCISREEVLSFPIRRDHYDRLNGDSHFINGIETVMEYVEDMPSVLEVR